MSEHLPDIGAKIFILKLSDGVLEMAFQGNVTEHLTEKNFTCGGFAHNIGSLYPCEIIGPGFDKWATLFLYAKEQDLKAAEVTIRVKYIQACDRAEAELQARAREIHAFAFEAAKPLPMKS